MWAVLLPHNPSTAGSVPRNHVCERWRVRFHNRSHPTVDDDSSPLGIDRAWTVGLRSFLVGCQSSRHNKVFERRDHPHIQ